MSEQDGKHGGWRGRRSPGLALGLAALAAATSVAITGAGSAAAATDQLEVTASPGLYPEFSPDLRTYVTRCTGDPVRVSVDAPKGTRVRIDRDPPRRPSFSRRVSLEPGAAFRIRARERGRRGERTIHRVRCLPGDFPEWEFERSARPDSRWLLTTYGGFVIVFDRRGTPVWWFDPPQPAIDAHLLGGARLAWGLRSQDSSLDSTPSYEIRDLNGKLERLLQTIGTPTDLHDLQEMPNGNYLLMSYKPRHGVDLTAYGGSADETVWDAEVQEVTPGGDVVWSWNSKDHIGLEETGRWWEIGIGPPARAVWDIVHMNSAEVVGDSMVISMRHTDAIYSIDRATGEIEWKLGGTDTPESLTVLGDPHGDDPLGGQHDARLIGRTDSVLTAFDNAHDLPRPPRAVRYRIDEEAGTARLVGSLADPTVADTFCCGSHRRTGDGGTVVTWGGTPSASGFDADGSVRYRLAMLRGGGQPLYRVVPVPSGELSAKRLRRGMNNMQAHDGRVSARILRARYDGEVGFGVDVRAYEHIGGAAAGTVRIRGTGKTYRVKAEAVRIRRGTVDRLELSPASGADARRLDRELVAGNRATARIRLWLRDGRFNRRLEKLRVAARR